MRRREILQKFHVAVEVDDESLIPVHADHLIQKALTGASFLTEHASLAHAGVYQQAQRQRDISFAREVANDLGASVFCKSEIIFVQAVDDLSVLVPRRG